MKRAPKLISLRGRGWPVICRCVAVIRLRNRRGFAVGVQAPMRGDGMGQICLNLEAARRRAKYLGDLHRLPVVEAI